MKFAYKFTNLLGSVYHEGNLLFTPDGNSVISPVGNRISIYDLKNNKSNTLPVESRFNFTSMDISPNGYILIAINEEGEAYIISMISKIVIHKYRFKRKVNCIKFSPDGKHFAVCKENNVFVFKAPGLLSGDYNPFVMERVFHDATDETTCLEWSFDSKLLAIGSKDSSTRLYSLQKWKNFRNNKVVLCHTDSIVGCFFEKNSYDISTISRNGHLCVWECSIEPDDLVVYEPTKKRMKIQDSDSEEDDVDLNKAIEKPQSNKKKSTVQEMEIDIVNKNAEDGDSEAEESTVEEQINFLKYKRLGGRHYLADEVRKDGKTFDVTAVAYHRDVHILVVGFENGSFFLYEIPEVNMIHSLSITQSSINTIALNNTGDWIALGCSDMGQLLVWEWQSETYAMKQQAHSSRMNSLAYCSDGELVATGGDDGKVKLWNMSSGFCTVTFHEHTSSVSQVTFSRNRKFVVSASLDGTVRAYDMLRYRNFRTLTSPRPVQFSCVAMDASDEFVCASGQDVFEIFLWSMKLGTLLEVLSGHEGPVMSLAFNPKITSTELVSVSWDKTLKIWNTLEKDSSHETIKLTADGLCVVYKPSGDEVAVATLDGQITFFDCKTSTQVGSIEGRKDLGSGRSETDLITAKKSLEGKAFTSLSYSADGTCILAGGQSKNVCIYNVKEALLLKKFEITQNRSFDAVDDFINRRKLTEFGNMALVEEREELEGGKMTLRLPGVKSGDMASRSSKPEVRIYSLQFSPTGYSWGAATTEGLLVYSLDTGLVFDPFELEIGITPDTIREAADSGELSKAIMMALKLNENQLIREVVEQVQRSDIALIVESLSQIYVERLLRFIACEVGASRHIHFYLLWIESILTVHGPKKGIFPQHVFLLLQKNLQTKYDELSKMCDFNQYTIDYLLKLGERNMKKKIEISELLQPVNDIRITKLESNDEEMQID